MTFDSLLDLIKDALAPITLIAITVFAYIFRRRGQKISELESDLVQAKADDSVRDLKNDIKHLEAEGKETSNDFNKAVDDFNAAVSRFNRNVQGGDESVPGSDKPGNGNHK